MSLISYLQRIVERQDLTADDAEQAMAAILGGQATTAQIASFLVALRMKGETAAELIGLARGMRAAAHHVAIDLGSEPLVDTCGTGGDGRGTFNISTIAAFVLAGAGVRVAKHGNRSISSRCGSADVLERLGVKVGLGPEETARAIREVGIGFLFAPAFHPAAKYVQPARVELKIRTVFNLLGPLTNPAGATVQVVGAPSVHFADLMAQAFAALGLARGYVFHGSDGLDEITTTGETVLFEIRNGAVMQCVVHPGDFGVPPARIDDLLGGDPDQNCVIAREVLEGAKGPKRDIVLVNAAAALVAAGKAATFVEGVAVAARTIDSGAAKGKLEQLVRFTAEVA